MQVSSNSANAGRLTVGNERLAALRKGRNFAKAVKFTKTDLTNECKVDDSVFELYAMRQDFYRRLTGDGENEPQSYEQLHSEITENHKGEERAKRVAILETVSNFVEQQMPTEQSNKSIAELLNGQIPTDFDFDKMLLPVGTKHLRDVPVTHNPFKDLGFYKDSPVLGDVYFSYSALFMVEFGASGIEAGMALFETVRQKLMENFEGDDLKARLAELEKGFEEAGIQHANFIAFTLMMSSPNYTPESDSVTLTREQAAANSRIEREANNLVAHIGGMFRAALDFFNATGSFAGFLDSPKANIPGMLSMRDVDSIRHGLLYSASSADIANTSGLSSSGKSYLQRFYRIS